MNQSPSPALPPVQPEVPLGIKYKSPLKQNTLGTTAPNSLSLQPEKYPSEEALFISKLPLRIKFCATDRCIMLRVKKRKKKKEKWRGFMRDECTSWGWD